MSDEFNIATFMKTVFTLELAKTMAEFLWTFYQELKKAGFTEEQAMNLCKFPEIKR